MELPVASLDCAYLDNAATTPLRPEAAEVLASYAHGGHLTGNPSGGHAAARRAKYALEEAREIFATVLGVKPAEVIFTSGGTEADNLAIAGTLSCRGGIAVCSATEHHAVLEPCHTGGGKVVPVHRDGTVDLAKLADSVGPEASVVSVMSVNNETGVVNDLAAVAKVVRKRAPRAVLHTDAVQSFCWMDVADAASVADLVSLSAHKFGGPQGVGVLVVRHGVELDPLLRGGGQERELRSGTPPVAAIVAAAAAARTTSENRETECATVRRLRVRLMEGITAALPRVFPVTDPGLTVPGIANLLIEGVENEELVIALDREGICVSAGASCASGAVEPSHVLIEMGLTQVEARSAIRFSLGWATTVGEVDRAVEAVVDEVARLREGQVVQA